MVKAKQDKRKRDIKSKLMAAIAMLLVSSIMMVSSTYAWFTLSTAPEVTGISTAVGANGNLEIALLNSTTAADLTKIQSTTGNSVVATNDITVSNVTWGNLVDVGNGNYGLEEITLYPAALNGSDGTFNATIPLKTPEYGVDGRVSQLAANTLTSIYENGTFAGTAGYGVRAIGTSSNMTAQMKDYRAARAAGDTARSAATTIAQNSIMNNGSVLADIAIAHGLDSSAKHTLAQMESLLAVVEDMEAAVEQIDEAYRQYIYASAIGGKTTEEQYTLLKSALGNYTTASELLGALTAENTANAPTGLETALGALETTANEMASARAILEPLVEAARADDVGYAWSEFDDVIGYLIDTDGVKVNGMTVGEIKTNTDAFVDAYMADGKVKLVISTGGGVYADVADHCADYDYGITISQISYGSMTLNDVPAHMYAQSTLPTRYLAAVRSNMSAAPTATSADQSLTTFYGYIIDLAFRTNAATSKLMLQQEAVDRIYSTSGGVEDETTGYSTMGGGSNMTLKAPTSDLSEAGIKELMGAIRVVFFTPPTAGGTDNTVLAVATLDTANATLTGDGWVADLIIVDEVTTTTYTAVDDGTGTHYQATLDNETVYVVKADYDAAVTAGTTDTEFAGYTVDTSKTYTATTTTTPTQTDGAITDLAQNQETAISVLVYLDGNSITNASVAATAATSLQGKLNLQFSSSTTLVPMEYADLVDEVTSSGSSSSGTSSAETQG